MMVRPGPHGGAARAIGGLDENGPMRKMLVVAGIGAAAGYLFGTEKGRAMLEQWTNKARQVAGDPGVQQKVSDLAGTVRSNADKLPDSVSGVVRSAADQVQTKLDHPELR
jgi:hypothetical protein